MRIKVYGGTPPNGGDSLCDTCRFSRIIRGRALDEEIVICDASQMTQTRITFKVTSCSDYSDHRVPSFGELIQQAWILRPGSRKRPAGFVRGSDLQAEEFAQVVSNARSRDR